VDPGGQLVDAVEWLVAGRPHTDRAPGDPAIVKQMPIGGAEADIPKVVGKRLARVGKDGVCVKDFAPQVRRDRPLVRATLPEWERYREILLHVPQVGGLPGHRLRREPSSAVVRA